jgi:mannan endo-1,4-beta-mannosidase
MKLLLVLATVLLLASCEESEDLWEGVLKEPDGSGNKVRLMNYLMDEYGNHIISGQMDCSWSDDPNMDMIKRVHDDTGKYPALKGFDFLNIRYPSWGGGGSKQTEEAIEWWSDNKQIPDKHGIVAFCWHWRMPKTGTRRGSDDDFYTENTAFRIPYKNGALDTGSPAWRLIEEDLDLVAAELQKLKDAGVPVLWRPLHEASGGWFWWGASGPAPYIALWEYMYDYLTKTKGLDNLIWVWNGQNAAWFPAADTVEIVGTDIYPGPRQYGSQEQAFRDTLEMVPDRNCMVALTENGAIPDPDNLIRDGAKWSFFMTWNDGGAAGINHKDNFWSGEYHNTKAHKQKVYNHSYVITLDELPDLTMGDLTEDL